MANGKRSGLSRFEALFMPHMNAAYDLARWLTGEEAAAKDVVQDSYLRAFRFQHRFAGGNARAWILTIVRNQSYTWLGSRGGEAQLADFTEDTLEGIPDLVELSTPEDAVLRDESASLLQNALASLPPVFREVIVLRELEDMSYKNIADVTGAPLGTIMSRLARARRMLRAQLNVPQAKI
jgi:RNA polymerase sigma-70 factor (ECF subfamily)